MSLSIDSIPGLAEMPRGQRYRLLGWLFLRSFADVRTWGGLVLAVVMAMLGQIAVRYAFPQLTTRQAPLWGFFPAVVFWLVGSHLSWKIRMHVVHGLIRRRFPTLCRACGYDLRGSACRCPECGTERGAQPGAETAISAAAPVTPAP